MSVRSRWLLIVSVLAAIACIEVCVVGDLLVRNADDIFTLIEESSALRVGSPAPDFSVRTLRGPDFQLSRHSGEPVLVTFAASWCPACRAEAPYQQRLHIQYPRLTMLLIDSDEPESDVRAFADEFGMTFPVGLDATEVAYIKYRVFSIPTTFFIDAAGIIRYINVGSFDSTLMAEKLPLIGVTP